ncbi:Rhs element Vgr protein [Chryseolinea serpens]|uniref:Rhs element Vgr protein n=1 Tax=Chryseolinea serpens TaxID=947013 RepID=A0A1M5UNB9_9BACT|nr:type VI secretion system tip protein VgrG [Chryseolinea serpens]SHH64368.1 Rhs element Vgr protein [Chryseolinea serpens]
MNASRVLPTRRPANLVTFTIKMDGEALPRTYGILSIVVNKEINKVPSAMVVIQDGSAARATFEGSNTELFIPGKEIEILAGYQSDESTIFKGIIIQHGIKIKGNGSTMLTLECKNLAVKLTVGAKHKYFVDKKDSEAIEDIIDAYGLDKDVEATTVQHKDLVQFSATDWDFMVARAEANGKVCLVDDGTITVKAPVLDGDPVLDLLYGGTILDFDATMDARDQYQAVKAFAWDPATQAIVETDGTDPAFAGNGNLAPSDLASVIGLEHLDLRSTGILSQEESQAWADAQWVKSQLSKIRGRVGIRGFGEVKPGDLINLDGLGDRMNGKVYVSGVRHEIGSGTWKTDIQFGLSPEWFTQTYPVNQLPASGMLPAIQGLQIGVVSQLKEDPAGEDRILVKLPIIDSDDTGIWSRVACMDAGDTRGSFFRPEIGDEVVVGFLNEDPRHAIVLGALNSSKKPAPLTATDENHEKGYVSRSGMKLIFNDDKKSIKIESSADRSFLLDEDAGVIKLEDGNGNKIVLNADGITIESKKKITLKTDDDIEIQGKNITHTAQMSFKADGSSGLELTSSAVAKLKGSLVQIN